MQIYATYDFSCVFNPICLLSLDELSAPRYIVPLIVSSWHHCDERQFHTLSYLHNFVSCRKLDLFIRSLLLDHILVLKKTTRTPRLHLFS